MPRKVLLAEPRGFCAGVEMAIKALTWMVRIFEPPVFTAHVADVPTAGICRDLGQCDDFRSI